MKIRFQADADLNEDILLGFIRIEPEVDFQTATEAGLRGLSDPEVLSHAARAGRILVTHDRRTMPSHFSAFIVNNTSPGVFIIGQNVSVRAAIDELSMIWTLQRRRRMDQLARGYSSLRCLSDLSKSATVDVS